MATALSLSMYCILFIPDTILVVDLLSSFTVYAIQRYKMYSNVVNIYNSTKSTPKLLSCK